VRSFGPPLVFTRTYDAAMAQQQAAVGTPGPLGFGWTDNWSASLNPSVLRENGMYTIAGRGTALQSNGTIATGAALNSPSGTATDASGNVFVADTYNNRVVEIAASDHSQWGIPMKAGRIYTVAGRNGQWGSSGDGGPATTAELSCPEAVAVDSSGDLFIADSCNSTVREVAAATGTQFGISMTANDIYTVAGTANTSGFSGDGGSGVLAELGFPAGVATNSAGDLFIADPPNNVVRELAASTGTQWGISMSAGDIYTVAGDSGGSSGSSGNGGAATSAFLSCPAGVAVDGSDDLLIADSCNSRVQEVAASSGTQWGIAMTANDVYTIAGSAGSWGFSGDGSAATGAELSNPNAVSVDSAGDLFIADMDNNVIREIAVSTGTQWGVSMTANDIYTVAGSSSGYSGSSGDGGPATSALLSSPSGVALGGSDDLYIADLYNNKVRRVSPSTANISTFAGGGSSTRTGNDGPALASGIDQPAAFATDSSGDLYFADSNNNRVQEIAATDHSQYGNTMTAGDIYTVAGDALGGSGSSGNGGAAADALLACPQGVAVDSSDNLYIADQCNNRIQEVPASNGTQYGISMTAGEIYTVAGDSTGSSGSSGNGGASTSALLDQPAAVTVTSGGDLFIADSGNNRVQEVAGSTGSQWGISMSANDIYTIAGDASGTSGLSGNGGNATSALLENPSSIALDSGGNLYIADTNNNRIQEVAFASGSQRGVSMSANHIYTVAGDASGTIGASGD